MKQIDRKLGRLRRGLKELGSVLVAFSGGVDSSFLLKVAKDALGKRVVAVTAVSETYTQGELSEARKLARQLKVRHRVIRTAELANPSFRRNPQDRCYFCKTELFATLRGLAKRYGVNAVVDGSNKDDLRDYRPGARAKKEYGVISPLQEAGLSKREIRELSRRLGLSTWDKPALACLASRLPYGTRITAKRLKRVQEAEQKLRRAFGLKGNLRVRDYSDRCRIEVDKKELGRLRDSAAARASLKPLGYKSVWVDPAGYRTGSLNEGVRKK